MRQPLLGVTLAWTTACGLVACGEVTSENIASPNDDAGPSLPQPNGEVGPYRSDETSEDTADANPVDAPDLDAAPKGTPCPSRPCLAGQYCETRIFGNMGAVAQCMPLADAGPCVSTPTCASCFAECGKQPTLIGCWCTEVAGELMVYLNAPSTPQNDQ